MVELWLNYKDANGEDKRVLVEEERFSIGRTPDNDLQISLGNLSRQHVKIERFADVFIVSDCDSSNGTFLNNERLTDPVSLKDGDKLNLADTIEIEVELISDQNKKGKKDGSGADGDKEDSESEIQMAEAADAVSGNTSAPENEEKGSLSLGFFILAPILGIFVLLIVGGAIFLLIPPKKNDPVIVQNNISDTDDDDEDLDPPANSDNKDPEKAETPRSTPTSADNSTNSQRGDPTPTQEQAETPTMPTVSGETQKIESASASFLRRIANNDPRAFLTESQIELIKPKINQLKNSGVLAENIRNAKKNAQALQTLAASRDLRAQFLANAAIVRLGNQRGDVLAAAKDIIENLSKITKPFGNESADECLLVIAAFSAGKTGEGLQETAGGLANKFRSVGVRRIRSIWFFKENGKLDASQFDYALRFLAIGTITQNPKEFNVQSEALQL